MRTYVILMVTVKLSVAPAISVAVITVAKIGFVIYLKLAHFTFNHCEVCSSTTRYTRLKVLQIKNTET